MLNFASENYAGVHPAIMQALTEANTKHAPSYGNDQYTAEAVELLKEVFGADIEVYFTFNGTGANNFGIAAVTQKYHSVFCSDVAHLYVDESTAPEAFIGCRIFPVKSEAGKIDPQALKSAIKRAGDIHHPQPKVVSITQPTEYGTVYTLEEINAIKGICAANNMLLHVDGARLFNAAVRLNTTLKEMITDTGVDVLTLGGTKAGMMFGEAVIFFTKAEGTRYQLKRSMQLASKNRFIAVQFTSMLKDELWKSIALHTNYLAKQVAAIPGLRIACEVETNVIFLNMSRDQYGQLHDKINFYYWNEQREEVRLVIAFDHTPDDIEYLSALLKQVC
jgi:threonine aldolase